MALHCKHEFHPECIGQWLRAKRFAPIPDTHRPGPEPRHPALTAFYACGLGLDIREVPIPADCVRPRGVRLIRAVPRGGLWLTRARTSTLLATAAASTAGCRTADLRGRRGAVGLRTGLVVLAAAGLHVGDGGVMHAHVEAPLLLHVFELRLELVDFGLHGRKPCRKTSGRAGKVLQARYGQSRMLPLLTQLRSP